MIYLNVGAKKSIRERDIIGIFDMDTATVSPITRDYLSRAERAGRTETPALEIPKSFTVYVQNGNKNAPAVCLSQFSSTALIGRIGKVSRTEE